MDQTTFNFDERINRYGTNSVKWEFHVKKERLEYREPDLDSPVENAYLPMWVADMDFKCAPAIVDALAERARQGVYGYSAPTDSYYEAVIGWAQRRHGWKIERDWIVLTPGVVPAIKYAVQAFIKPGEKVLIQPPVYHPFRFSIENNGAVVKTSPLIYENGCYRMDFDDLAKKAADPGVKMAILCSPHNPVGRVWEPDELKKYAEICLENNLLVIADEVHCDLIYKDYTFTAYATKCEEPQFQNSIICRAASKSFNLAGLSTSSTIIPNEAIREQYLQVISRSGSINGNTFGLVATEAAFNHGAPWLDAAMDYIEENLKYMENFFSEHLPEIKIVHPEGTYLVWVDFSALGLDRDARKKIFLEEAQLSLDEGELFGEEGQGFERFNIACPRAILVEALERVRNAVRKRLAETPAA